MHENLDSCINGTIPAGQRHIIFSKWVGEAWAEVNKNKEMIKTAFEKCGISLPIDGSKDEAIGIKGLDGYQVRFNQPEDAADALFELDTDSELSQRTYLSSKHYILIMYDCVTAQLYKLL